MGGFICICGCCPFVVSVVFMSLYAVMYAQASEMQSFNVDRWDDMPLPALGALVRVNPNDYFIYDTCMIKEGGVPLDTKWSTILLFNMILYAVLSVSTICMCFTCVAWPIGYLGAMGHSFGCCAHLAAIIITGIYRYSDEGEMCAQNPIEAQINDNGDKLSFEEHANMIQGLFISACVLFCCFNIFAAMISKVSRQLIMLKRGPKQ